MKKKTLFILVVSLVLGMILPQAQLILAENRPSISYYAYWTGSLEPGSYCEIYLEDRLDMDIEVRKISHTDKEAVNLMLASGEMPDCGWFEHTVDQMEDEELIRYIPVEMVEEHFPGFIDLADENPMIYKVALAPDDPTQFRFFPDIYEGNSNLHNNCMYLRYDWIKNLDIDLGVNVEQLNDQLYIADNGITREVLHEVLDGFVNEDPDGNGEKDTFGLLKDWEITLVPSTGLVYGGNRDLDGLPIDWYADPEMKDLLAYVRDLYAEGLIYPEIFTVAWGEDWELINNSKAGILAGSAVATVWLQSWASNRPPLSLFEANPDAELLMIPGIVGPDGEVHHFKPHNPGRWERFFVNADVDDEQLVNILKFLQEAYFSDDPDTVATLVFGEKGVDWEWNEDESAPQLINTLQNGERGTQVFARNMIFGDQYRWTLLEDPFVLGVKYYIEDDGGVWNEMMRHTYKADVANETEAGLIQTEYGQDWEAARKSYFLDVIMGNKDLEGDWDAYIDSLNSLHYDEYREELNKVDSIEDILTSFE